MSSGRQLRSQSRKDVPTAQPFVLYTKKEFETSTTPNDLCCALQGLTAAQKADIRDMGFESLTSFNIHNIPAGLGYWLLANYDHKRSELNVGNRIIKITPSKVHDVFGVPMGKITVSEHKRPRVRDDIREKWKKQFDQTNITVKLVTGKLKSCKKGGTLFKQNFLVLFNSIMGETTTKRPTVNQKFLASIINEGDISNMDWCGYMITCLNRTRSGWDGTEPYNGPLTFLAVLYAHEQQLTRCPENATTPAIKYVTTDYLVDLDLESSMRGKGPFLNCNVEAQTAIEQNVVSQSEEDEFRFHTATPNVTSVETGGATRKSIDRRISHCNQLESRSDENVLDDVDIELLEPKQEECELDENMPHMSGSFSSRRSGIARVKGYEVNRDIAPTLVDIIKKHGDFAAECVLESSSSMKSTILESVCEVFRRIQTNDIVPMSEAGSVVLVAKAVNIDVSWLEALLETVRKRKEAKKQYCLCLEAKATIILLKRVAQMDVRDRRAELVAAQERSKEAERCAEVLRLVGKHLHDNLMESEADSDSWVEDPVA